MKSVKLREKIAQSEKQLEQAQRESSEARKEIEQRKQHTNILLSRIRELQVRARSPVTSLVQERSHSSGRNRRMLHYVFFVVSGESKNSRMLVPCRTQNNASFGEGSRILRAIRPPKHDGNPTNRGPAPPIVTFYVSPPRLPAARFVRSVTQRRPTLGALRVAEGQE